MKSYAHPGSLIGSLPSRQPMAKSRLAVFDEDWPMLRLVGWAATTAVLALLIWQTVVAEPLWPRAVSGFLLVIVSVLAGLRLGADSAAAYTKDLQRLNKVLAEQNRELQESNVILLKQINSEAASPSSSA